MVTYLSGGRIQGKTTDTASGGNTTYTISGTEDTDYTVGTVGANTTITITKTGATTFTPSAGATVNYVVVGGGGGAGQDGHSITAPRGGGGGGAGAYRESGVTTSDTAFTSVAEAYTITIGTGGAGATSGGKGSNGTASSLNSSSLSIITSDGGGGGGGAVDNGTNEGLSNGNASGGGASNSGTGGAGGTYGYAGSNGSSSSQYNGGGGGGASAVGVNATTSSTGGGIGGAGRTPSTTYFSHSIIAGGGGGFTGGTGGSGGGGNASASGTVGIAGTANTGSGGGATGNANGGAGGTGIVILSFTTVMSVAADKSSITDVPVGTRYEETDTRKIFRRKSTGSTVRALGDVVWDASESTGETISGNDVYFDHGNAWNYWARSTDDFTMGAGLATIIWKPHSVATSPAQHTMLGFGKDPISASSANYDNIEFYQYIESNSTYRAFEINSSNTVPAVNMGNLSGTLTTSTILKITMDINGQVKYYIDLTGGGTFVLYATSTRNATAGTYYIHCTGKELGGGDDVTFSVLAEESWVEKGTA